MIDESMIKAYLMSKLGGGRGKARANDSVRVGDRVGDRGSVPGQRAVSC